jgi:putative membrane protein
MRRHAFLFILIGTIAVITTWSILWGIGHVQDAFATGNVLGWMTVGSFSMVLCGVGYLCFREIVGYWSIRTVHRLADALISDDVDCARRMSLRWLRSISTDHAVDQQLHEVESANSVAEIKQSVSTIVCLIDAKVDRTIAMESVLIGAAVGISPWPLIDGAIVMWRQLRLMRTIAKRYGARPSTYGTVRLLKHVLVAVVLADASEHATQWIASKIPSLGGLIPSAGQAVAIIVLTVRLGRACKTTCRPIARQPKPESKSIGCIRDFIAQTMQQYKKHPSGKLYQSL